MAKISDLWDLVIYFLINREDWEYEKSFNLNILVFGLWMD